MTLEELNVFCGEMYKRLEFKCHRERRTDILKWAGDWQSKRLAALDRLRREAPHTKPCAHVRPSGALEAAVRP